MESFLNSSEIILIYRYRGEKMSTNFKHKNAEEIKFNISSVASGKDILSLTKVIGEMIDGKEGKSEEKVQEKVKVKVIPDDQHQLDKKINIDNINDHSDTSSSVENFKELFSYRKPILLEELEKARRSLEEGQQNNLEENILSSKEKTNEIIEILEVDEKINVIEDEINKNNNKNEANVINKENDTNLNNLHIDDLDESIFYLDIIEDKQPVKKDLYPSTQAALARERINDLIEQREVSKLNADQITLDLEINEKNEKTIENIKLGVKGPVYKLPQWNLLRESPEISHEHHPEESLSNAALLEETLANFGVKAQVTNYSEGPTITRYEIQPAPGVKVSRIVNLADDIALCLAAGSVRIEAPIPGKSAVGIEVPNNRNQAVYLKEIITDGSFVHGSSKIMVALGKDIAGKPTVADLSRMPHLLIAGSTGSGKSVCMNSIITSILFRANPDEVKFLMVDPKMVELSVYNGIPHLIAPVITDPKKATAALKWVVNEMENRYNLFASNGARNIESYNKSLVSRQEKPLPFVVVLIDELADLMMVASRDVEESICRLAQKARAAGIHLVIATQRPSVDVITGIIKANIPSRISFAVSSQIDSRTILDLAGAEKLLGRGDMLFSPIGISKPIRVQGVYVSDEEVEEVVSYWKKQGKPEYETGVLQEVETTANGTIQHEEDDELLDDAIKLIIQSGQASVSLLQRRFRIGYTRAARLIDLMEERGIIGGYEGSKPRTVLMSLEEYVGE